MGRFRSDERGALTAEFVLWLPIFVALLLIVVHATTLYVTHAEMWNVARDTARRMITGNLLTEAEAEAYAASSMKLRDLTYYVDANYDATTGAEVIVAIRANDLWIIGYSPLAIFGTDLAARVVMPPDPSVEFGGAGGA